MRCNSPGNLARAYILAIFLIVSTGAHALEMTEGRIAAFQRDVMRTLTELMPEATDAGPDVLSIELHNRTIRNIPVRDLHATIDGIDRKLRESLAQKTASFDDLSRVRSVDVEADIDANDARRFISEELARQGEGHRALTGLQITFGTGSVKVTGMVDFSRIPRNPLSFINPGPLPFSADAALLMVGNQLTIDISNAILNNVPFVPPLSTQVLAWLNPLMDFSALPHEASLTKLEITPSGISLRGFLFSR